MSTPINAPYKKRQRTGRAAVKNRGKVLWISCQIFGGGPWMKRVVQGTRVGSFKREEC